MDKPPLVDAIILNFNSGNILNMTLKENMENMKGLVNYIIVDNGSIDNSIKIVEEGKWPYPFKIIKTGKNLGCSGGLNVGIRNSSSKYLLLLNEDIVVGQGIEKMISLMENDSSIGILGTRVYNFYDRNKIDSDGTSYSFWFGRASAIVRDTGAKGLKEVPFVGVGAGIFRRDMLEKINLLDESYFIYYEDIDTSIKCWGENYRVAILEELKMFHIGSWSSSVNIKNDKIRVLKEKNSTKVYLRFYSYGQIILTILPFTLYRLAIFTKLLFKPKSELYYFLRSYFEILLELPKILKTRNIKYICGFKEFIKRSPEDFVFKNMLSFKK